MACFVPFNGRDLDISLFIFRPTVVLVDEFVDDLKQFSLCTESLGCVQNSIFKSIHGNMVRAFVFSLHFRLKILVLIYSIALLYFSLYFAFFLFFFFTRIIFVSIPFFPNLVNMILSKHCSLVILATKAKIKRESFKASFSFLIFF
jgi:hypothetical protein